MLTRLIRLRLARVRVSRALSSLTPLEQAPPPLPPLSALALPENPVHPFPLYRPPPTSTSAPLEPLPTSLDGLPSDRALQVRQKQKLTRAVEAGVEEYTEDELREFYAAVVSSGAEDVASSGLALGASEKVERISSPIEEGTGQVRTKVLSGLAGRFLPLELGDMAQGTWNAEIAKTEVGVHGIVDALMRFAEDDERASGSGSVGSGGVRIPLGVVSRLESRVLMQDSVRLGDAASLVDLLETLPRLGLMVEREQIASLLEGIISQPAKRTRRALSQGQQEVVSVLSSVIAQQSQLRAAEQDALIRVHLLSDHTASSAIASLRYSESLSLPAPQSTYNLVLSHLTTSSPTSISRATAWDLFTHMRLVAHPIPTPKVYATMISSCAASSEPKPEMARDLWIQMTQEHRLQPTEPEYTAYIRALCSTRGTYLEGFDVFRQMLARHHEATYVPFGHDGGSEAVSRYIPTNATWKALLEGTKRAGDLPRARWVLQECVRLHGALGGQSGMGVDEEVMGSVFMTYAAWKPALRRAAVKDREGAAVEKGKERAVEAEQTTEEEKDGWEEPTPSGALDRLPSAGEGGMLSSRVPLTSADAIREAQLLFDALLPSPPSSSSTSPSRHTIFSDVHLSARLINSFLSVTYAHAPTITDCRAAWDAATPHYGSTEGRNGWSYLHALERCSIGQRGRAFGSAAEEERAASLSWAKDLWAEYLALSQILLRRLHSSPAQPGLAYSLGISPRQTERCWRAIIRIHALSGDLSTSLDLLTQFHSTYPPEHITQAYSPNAEHGFSVRFTDPTLVLEADVPPFLLWKDVDVLHQRLVRDEQLSEVGRVKWVCAAYEAALGKRRRWRLDGVGRGREGRKDRLERVGQAEAGDVRIESVGSGRE